MASHPAKIGMVGFSAGAMLTLTTELSGGDAKPAFIGIIYGPLSAVEVPADAPPMFVALAADDPFSGGGDFGLINSWRAAKKPVEFHLFEQGGHGFGMYQKPTTSTGWFDELTRWLAMHGWVGGVFQTVTHVWIGPATYVKRISPASYHVMKSPAECRDRIHS